MNVVNRLYIYNILLIFLVITLPQIAYGAIVFEDGFDNYNWTSTYAYGNTVTGKNNAPFNLTADFSKAGWVSYRESSTANTLGNPTWAVTTEASHSGGKSLKYELENTTSLWSGGGMTIYLGGPDNSVSGYNELYISLWMKFENGYVVPTVTNGFAMKLFRIYFGDNADLETSSLSGGYDYNNNNKLQTYVDFKGNGYIFLREFQFPSTKIPKGQSFTEVATGDSPHLTNYIQWNRVMYHIKLNTYGNSDGLLELYIGDTKVASINNIELVNPNEGSIENNKINTISVPDNYYNIAYGMPVNSEVGFYIDDLVISTSYVPLNYVIGGIPPSDTTAPTTTASPSGGTYSSAQTVTLSANESAKTYYTLNGSTPNTYSAVYSSAITVSQSATLKFFSVDAAGNPEQVKTTAYTISPASGPAAYLKFDSNFSDSGPNNLSVTGYGGAGFVSGKLNQAANFDGVDDYVRVNDSSQINFDSGVEFTITFWLKGSNATQAQMLFSKVNNTGYQLIYNPASKKLLFRINEGATLTNTYSNIANIFDGQWHHIAVGRSQSQHFIYIDGKLDATTANATLPNISNGAPLDIGSEAGSVVYAGLIDDMHIYNRALSSSEIQNLFNISGQDIIPPAAPTWN